VAGQLQMELDGLVQLMQQIDTLDARLNGLGGSR
jgi:hypothetical protein